VEWFNQVDLTYRTELRELNDLNFARFDARLEQRVAGLEARIDVKITELESRIDVKIAQLESRIDVKMAQLEAKLERRLGEQSRWLFAAWLSLLIPIIGLGFAAKDTAGSRTRRTARALLTVATNRGSMNLGTRRARLATLAGAMDRRICRSPDFFHDARISLRRDRRMAYRALRRSRRNAGLSAMGLNHQCRSSMNRTR
jgi:hypothetical protein